MIFHFSYCSCLLTGFLAVILKPFMFCLTIARLFKIHQWFLWLRTGCELFIISFKALQELNFYLYLQSYLLPLMIIHKFNLRLLRYHHFFDPPSWPSDYVSDMGFRVFVFKKEKKKSPQLTVIQVILTLPYWETMFLVNNEDRNVFLRRERFSEVHTCRSFPPIHVKFKKIPQVKLVWSPILP